LIATKDANRRDRFKRRDDVATKVLIDARRQPKGTAFVDENMSQRNIHARHRTPNEHPIRHHQITTKPVDRRERSRMKQRRENSSVDRAPIVSMIDPTNVRDNRAAASKL
jgi:hypothetical protein